MTTQTNVTNQTTYHHIGPVTIFSELDIVNIAFPDDVAYLSPDQARALANELRAAAARATNDPERDKQLAEYAQRQAEREAQRQRGIEKYRNAPEDYPLPQRRMAAESLGLLDEFIATYAGRVPDGVYRCEVHKHVEIANTDVFLGWNVFKFEDGQATHVRIGKGGDEIPGGYETEDTFDLFAQGDLSSVIADPDRWRTDADQYGAQA